ncbi:Pentatricopeptide repeat-containing protein, chloroplastic [Symbiodinium microadriaticum]|uniref:Pentatricopeptide repeat-containing protein, chloroplastic n=1 Tax=Symbiodinium microadriaticum TaxID=2951 RepID=A0A1Q9DR46_SYMMI|nr:Pentatricopeptide repeat-containing protein, chloroplastic [Symbiodinium microadriaticum]CAE7243688.1 EMB2654 [Symbiodinium microadriaticum]CAE7949352.1 EMB2654 [Symbiodinium sp. KB8]
MKPQPGASGPLSISAAVKAAGKRKDWESALFCLYDKRALSPGSEQRWHPLALAPPMAAMGICARASAWASVIQVLDAIHACDLKPDLYILGSALNACDRGYAWSAALHLLCGIGKYGLDFSEVLVNSATTACDKGNQWACSLWLLSDFGTKRCRLDSVIGHSAAMSSCARFERHWARSLVLFDRLQHRFTPDIIAYNSVMHACSTGAAVEVANHILAQMQRRGPPPDLVTFNTFITALSNSHAWSQCLGMLEQLQKTGPAPSVVTYNAVLSSLGHDECSWTLTIVLLEAMHDQDVLPDVVTFGSIMKALARASQSKVALSFLSWLERNHGPTNEVVYSAAVSACEGGWLWKESIALIGRARRMSLKMDAMVYGAACSTCQKSQRWEHAIRFLGTARDQSVANTASTPLANAAISSCADSAQWFLASQLFQSASSLQVEADTTTHNACLTAFSRQWETVLHLMALASIQEAQLDTVSLNAQLAAIAAEGAASTWRQAVHTTATEMRRRSLEIDTIGLNAAMTSLSSEWVLSGAMLAQMRSVGLKADVLSMGAALASCSSCQQWAAALLLLPFMQDDANIKDRDAGPLAVAVAGVIDACQGLRESAPVPGLLMCLRRHLVSVPGLRS